MGGEIRRENFADEASYLQFQANMLEMQRREAERQRFYVEPRRDYAIVKKMRERKYQREWWRQWKIRHPDRYLHQAFLYRARHRDEINARARTKYANNPVFRKHRLELCRQWHEQHRDELQEYNRRYYASHREKINAYHREYYKTPNWKAKQKEYSQNYKARKMANDPSWLENNRKRARERMRDKRTDPDWAEKHRQQVREYTARNRDDINKRRREKRASDPELRARDVARSRERYAAKKLAAQQQDEQQAS